MEISGVFHCQSLCICFSGWGSTSCGWKAIKQQQPVPKPPALC